MVLTHCSEHIFLACLLVFLGMFQTSVHLRGVDFDLSIEGGLRMTPQEARLSGAANMILELSRQAEEEKSEDESTISGVA